MRRYFLTSVVASLLALPLAAQVTTTTGAPDQYVGPMGRDSELGALPTAFAQTFVIPNGTNNLESFSFYITNFFGGEGLLLDASVYAFSSDHLVGNALYSTQLTGTALTDDVQLMFGSAGSPLNVSLAQGNVYAFVLSAADRFSLTPDGSSVLFGGTSADAYGDGALFLSQGNDLDALKSGGAFVEFDGVPDAAFSATFTNVAGTVVPEPASVAMLGMGIMLLGVVNLRRKRRQ